MRRARGGLDRQQHRRFAYLQRPAVAQGVDGLRGIVALGYPLHPPGKPEKARDEHLPGITVPMLFLQGRNDPFAIPNDQLDEVVARYPAAGEIVWLQEEPANMGAWAFAQDRLAERFAESHTVLRVSRYESGSPATGSHTIHVQEQEAILDAALSVA
jgi:predicted alpha/beta-hydrolase family hydrolase